MKDSRKGSLRVVISGHEICGLIHDLTEEFRRRGHSVTSVAMPHQFFSYSYDYDQYTFPTSFLSRWLGFNCVWRRIIQAVWETSQGLHNSIEAWLRQRLVRNADLYVRVWGDIPFDQEVFRTIEDSGTRVATMLMGSDVRDYDVFRQQYGIERWLFPPEYHSVPLAKKLQVLRTHERYADAIFSAPDQMGLALRPYHHLQIPLRLEEIEFRVPGRTVPKVVHIPSMPHVKGTDVIEDALERLRTQGIEFDLVSLRDVPHAEVLEVLADADVLVDELIGHGPGWLSFEAMGSGCAVATRYLEDSPACFRPPVWGIDEHSIVPRLHTLLTDRRLRVQLAEDGRRYVEANNGIEHVVDQLLEKLHAGRDAAPDYVPTYLTADYVPRDEAEAAVINAASTCVAGETWYRENVAGKSHDGLVF
ncbi:MAG: glycosyltransferase [Gemmatimonadaceae bacterium]